MSTRDPRPHLTPGASRKVHRIQVVQHKVAQPSMHESARACRHTMQHMHTHTWGFSVCSVITTDNQHSPAAAMVQPKTCPNGDVSSPESLHHIALSTCDGERGALPRRRRDSGEQRARPRPGDQVSILNPLIPKPKTLHQAPATVSAAPCRGDGAVPVSGGRDHAHVTRSQSLIPST